MKRPRLYGVLRGRGKLPRYLNSLRDVYDLACLDVTHGSSRYCPCIAQWSNQLKKIRLFVEPELLVKHVMPDG